MLRSRRRRAQRADPVIGQVGRVGVLLHHQHRDALYLSRSRVGGEEATVVVLKGANRPLSRMTMELYGVSANGDQELRELARYYVNRMLYDASTTPSLAQRHSRLRGQSARLALILLGQMLHRPGHQPVR